MGADSKDPLYARYLVYLTRPFPDFDFSFIKPVRQKAVESLNLKEGDRALDAGCGSGGSFPLLRQCIGSTGEVIGIEISPGTVINTKRRIAKNKWSNVQVIEGDASTVNLTGKFDGLVMFAAPDIFASEKAIANIFPHLRERARVAFFGAKISNRTFGWILNGLLRMAFKLSFSTTPALEREPWRLIGKQLDDLQVREYFFGSMFLAHGTLK